MIVEQKDTAQGLWVLKIRAQKIRMVLDWLLEFRFSTADLLARRIGQTKKNAWAFLSKLEEEGLLQSVTNTHTGERVRYLLLTKAGASYLEAQGRDISKAVTRTGRIGSYTTILHDLNVQEAILRRINELAEIHSERNLSFASAHDRPDALVVTKKGVKTAIEYERSRKDEKRVYLSFMAHVKHITSRHYAGVYFLFSNENDKLFYEKLFAATEWPRFQRKSKIGVITRLDGVFKPDEIVNLRACFVFQFEGVAAPK